MIRPARGSDADAIAAIYRSYVEHGTISFETVPPDAATIRDRMATGGGRYPWLVNEADGAVAGYAYASAWSPRQAYDRTVETTIYLAPDARGRGLGPRLYQALLDLLTERGFAQAIGRISLPNPSSEALHTALGYREAGTLRAVGWKEGRWIDVAHWQRALAPAGAPPR